MKHTGLKLNNRGAAMMVCIIIIAILMIFTFSLLAVSYTLYSSQNNAMQDDKNSEAAKSLAVAIRDELTAGTEESSLCKYLRYNIVADPEGELTDEQVWPCYDPSREGHDAAYAKRYFLLKKSEAADIPGYPSETGVCMWWTKELKEGSTDPKVYLFVETECRSGSQSYVVRSRYQLKRRKGNDTGSSYPAFSGSRNLNPVKNRIDTSEVWLWKFVESE
ncbi:MAG: hypothetical protein K5697_11030 [Lachnospiraceae bacterium]|nr:hypothetical protein [Lachnospiraceae bacterium]